MGRCVICNCEVSNNPFSTKDKYELFNHSYICKDCANKIGITNIWRAAKYTAEKAKDKYYQLYPRQTQARRECENLENGYVSQLCQEGKSLDVNATPSEDYEEKESESILCATDTDAASGINASSRSDETTSTVDTSEEGQQTAVYSFPPKSLLRCTKKHNSSYGAGYLRENTRQLQETLRSLEIDASVVHVIAGPISIRFELELERGVRLAEIQYRASDIALALGCKKVSIAPVVGKCSVVAIDVPQRYIETVCLHEVINSREFMTKQSSLAYALGKDIIGNEIVCDLNKERHLLIGGTTGSGKSTLLHSLIISMLYRASPDDIRFVMVDTNGLELTPYNGIPQMLIPVITDERKAAGALQWLNTELLRRYKILSNAGVTSLDAFNHLVADAGETLPHIVAIIDDVFYLFSPKDDSAEDLLRNLILRGHVVGIHLVLTTQHAYTGAIVKIANLRNMGKIALALPGRYDSIALLGKDGAETLSGKGEMLYLPIGSSVAQRIQGCFVSDSEVAAVTGYIKGRFSDDVPVQESIVKNVQPQEEKSGASADNFGGDELLPKAVDVVLETGMASVSMLQRRLKLGYARASRIVDEMEEKGIVGPFQGSQPRVILVTKEQWKKMKNS